MKPEPFKKPKYNLKRYQFIFFQIGLIVVMSFLLALFKLPIRDSGEEPDMMTEEEMAQVKEVIQTKQKNEAPAPPKPQVPVEVPDDEVVKDETIKLDSELDLEKKLDIPEKPTEPEKKKEEKIFVAVQQKPELKGGMKRLQQKVDYPEQCRKAGVEGRVVVQFVVDKQGDVLRPDVVRGIAPTCNEEALRVIRTADFKPARQRGRKVNYRATLPIIFDLRGR